MVWRWLSTVGIAVVKAANFVVPHSRYITDLNLHIPENSAFAEQKEEIYLAQLKLYYLQNQENIDFQAQQRQLSDERANELQAFIQFAKIVSLDKQFDFLSWRLEQEKSIQLEILELNHQLQRQLVIEQRQISLKIVEDQKQLENLAIWLIASDILKSESDDNIIPLRIFLAPPKFQFERFSHANNDTNIFPNIELTLAEGLRQFFRNYSQEGKTVDFLAGAWVSKSFHSEASIKALFSVLKSEPTLVLESEVDGDYLNFRIAYWGLNWSKYRYDPIISRLPYREILYESAKNRARNWREIRAKLIAAGVSESEADETYGKDNIKNWETLQLEEQLKQAGIPTNELTVKYFINKKDVEELGQFLIICNCLFAGLIADEYFLFQHNISPLLPKLLAGLTENVPDQALSHNLIEAVVWYYQKIYQTLENTRATLTPELALNLALSLVELPNKSWAKNQIIYSIKSWLQLRKLPQIDGVGVIDLPLSSLLDALELVLMISDKEYVEKLNQCLVAVGNERQLNVMDACYKRGINLVRKKDYQAAILNFNQLIQRNYNSAEIYYNRGFAYAELGEYHQAIEDYTKAIEMNQQWADLYNYRGNAYYKLENYGMAMADYDQAINILQLSVGNLTENFLGNDEGIFDFDVDPDEQMLVSGINNNSINPLPYFIEDDRQVYSLALGSDDENLITDIGSSDENIKANIWRLL
ncbi:MAG TPA: tetratricopeptide repeat protein [Oculatellaceae cyanobacterium]|jgi:tetratricopeptide (TPR) repeat protein